MGMNRFEREESGKLVDSATLDALRPQWDTATVIAKRAALARSRISTALVRLAAAKDSTVGVKIEKNVSYYRRQGARVA